METTISLSLEKIFRLSPYQKRALAKLGILSAGDLLRHFPTRYGDVAVMKNIGDLVAGETAVVFGKISNLKISKAFYKKIPMAEAKITDESGGIKIIWFNQPYIAKMFLEEMLVRVEGKISEKKNKLYLSNPKIEKVEKIPIGVGESLFGSAGDVHHLYPVYPESRGISSNWLYHSIQKILKSGILENLTDQIPSEILQKYNLPGLKTALIWIHAPKTENDALAARKRFAFEEVFFIQLERQKVRREYEQNPSFKIVANETDLTNFKSRFSFTPTGAQERALSDILADFSKNRPMLRLLEGDVGSGKTVVALIAAYLAAQQGWQTIFMAPTEVLAQQHYQTITTLLNAKDQMTNDKNPITVGLLTANNAKRWPTEGILEEDIGKAALKKKIADENYASDIKFNFGVF